MTTILNFKKVEIVAASKDEAINQINNTYFHVNGDATQAFKNWKQKQNGAVTEREIKEFMLDYLSKKGKNCPGAGYIITMDAAIGDTRERPYRMTDVPNEGKRKFKTVYTWVDDATGVAIVKCDTNKADAKNALKELYKVGEYKGNAKLHKVKEVVEGQAVVATAEYTPSKNTKNGTWLAFGIEA
jgi:hypothetical protein